MHPLTATLLAIAVSASLGGILLGITQRTSHKIRVPFRANLLELGFLGDGLVGAGVGLGVFFLAAPLLDLRPVNDQTLDQWVPVYGCLCVCVCVCQCIPAS